MRKSIFKKPKNDCGCANSFGAQQFKITQIQTKFEFDLAWKFYYF